ncbi:MAG: hypothetical protein ABFD82_00095 [Syntrophaceae bacterium]
MEFEKYDIEVPARIEVISSHEEEYLYLHTAHVSAKEVLFRTAEPLPKNVHVRLDLMLHFTKPGNLRNSGTAILIHVTGTVTRTDQDGMTIAINEDYQITKVRVPAMLKSTCLPVEACT